jgi:hypothetical protein
MKAARGEEAPFRHADDAAVDFQRAATAGTGNETPRGDEQEACHQQETDDDLECRHRLREGQAHGIRLAQRLGREQENAAQKRERHRCRGSEVEDRRPALLRLCDENEGSIVVGSIHEQFVGARQHYGCPDPRSVRRILGPAT